MAPTNKSSILIVDDDEDILFSAQMALKPYFENIITEVNPKIIKHIIPEQNVHVVLLDMNFTKDTTSGSEGFFWLNEIKNLDPEIIVVLITAFGDVNLAVNAMKAGATDFILKPWTNEKLVASVNAALELSLSKRHIKKLESNNTYMKSELGNQKSQFIGESSVMKSVFDTIEKVAQTDINILITGENGTGKELVARSIHDQSNRSKENFVPVDLGSLADTLFESELFGHMKGAFTGALENKVGRFEFADKGTLFLDEIGNISQDKQMKLLSILQNREVIPVGSTKGKPIDIRVISATNMPLDQMISENQFRQDLLYRLNTVEIKLPALRDRTEDIPLLIKYYLDIFNLKYKKKISFPNKSAMQKLLNYNWPGNIRELQHSIERAVILAEDNSLDISSLILDKQRPTQDFPSKTLEEVERDHILKIVNNFGGNLSQASKELGITRQALYRRLEKYDL